MTHNGAKTTQKQRASFTTKHYCTNGCENNGQPSVTYNGLKPPARLGWEAADVHYTIIEAPRREVLQHLLKLNHERYAEEVKQGLDEKKRGTVAGERGQGKKAPATKPAKGEATLFDLGEDDT